MHGPHPPGDDVDLHDLTTRFNFHPATPDTGPKHDKARTLCRQLAAELNELLPEGREQSLAITNLEIVMFWANAAIAREGK